ncbi:unnamed protein product [Lepidochelys olivacea]
MRNSPVSPLLVHKTGPAPTVGALKSKTNKKQKREREGREGEGGAAAARWFEQAGGRRDRLPWEAARAPLSAACARPPLEGAALQRAGGGRQRRRRRRRKTPPQLFLQLRLPPSPSALRCRCQQQRRPDEPRTPPTARLPPGLAHSPAAEQRRRGPGCCWVPVLLLLLLLRPPTHPAVLVVFTAGFAAARLPAGFGFPLAVSFPLGTDRWGATLNEPTSGGGEQLRAAEERQGSSRGGVEIPSRPAPSNHPVRK